VRLEGLDAQLFDLAPQCLARETPVHERPVVRTRNMRMQMCQRFVAVAMAVLSAGCNSR
jgi:hypothetical protein